MLRGFQEIGHRFPSFQVSWFSLVSAGCHCGETRGNQNAKVLMNMPAEEGERKWMPLETAPLRTEQMQPNEIGRSCGILWKTTPQSQWDELGKACMRS